MTDRLREKELEVDSSQQQLAEELAARRKVQYQFLSRERLVHEKDKQVLEKDKQVLELKAEIASMLEAQSKSTTCSGQSGSSLSTQSTGTGYVTQSPPCVGHLVGKVISGPSITAPSTPACVLEGTSLLTCPYLADTCGPNLSRCPSPAFKRDAGMPTSLCFGDVRGQCHTNLQSQATRANDSPAPSPQMQSCKLDGTSTPRFPEVYGQIAASGPTAAIQADEASRPSFRFGGMQSRPLSNPQIPVFKSAEVRAMSPLIVVRGPYAGSVAASPLISLRHVTAHNLNTPSFPVHRAEDLPFSPPVVRPRPLSPSALMSPGMPSTRQVQRFQSAPCRTRSNISMHQPTMVTVAAMAAPATTAENPLTPRAIAATKAPDSAALGKARFHTSTLLRQPQRQQMQSPLLGTTNQNGLWTVNLFLVPEEP